MAAKLTYSPKELAQALGYAIGTIYNLAAQRSIPGRIKPRGKGHARYKAERVEAWVRLGMPARVHWPAGWS